MVFKIRTLSLPKPRTKEDLLIIHGAPPRRFSLRDLKVATDNFSTNNIVGRGGYGTVYRGVLPDGSVVAVKRRIREPSSREEIEFEAEMEIGRNQILSKHRNVIRLRGYCMTRKERLLVYPFMANGNLASRLWDRPASEPPLDWAARKRIALGAAKGLAHFHCGSSFSVIHRDVKPANILLDDQFEPILSDFGSAKFLGGLVQRPMEEEDYDDGDHLEEEEDESDLENKQCFTTSCWNFTKTLLIKSEDGDHAREESKEEKVCTTWTCWLFTKNEVKSLNRSETIGPPVPNGVDVGQNTQDRSGTVAHAKYKLYTHLSTAVCGTPGYLDPAYYATSRCSHKTDVYGYGIVLLELITGKRTISQPLSENGECFVLLPWVKELVEDNNWELVVDSNLRENFIDEEMEQLLQLALLCTRDTPEERPVMTDVIKMIENIGKLSQVQRFSLPQLQLATDNFSATNMISRSRFSKVYRGRLQEDGSTVVVKRLVNGSKRKRQQFQAEIKMGSMITKGLLRLRGYCISGKDVMLVYPFMANRSLKWQLRPESILPLDWPVRRKIALGAAKGIACLHYDYAYNIIICRHVKPSNILLDDKFNPVLYNLRLQSSNLSQVHNKEDSSSDHSDTDGSSQNGYQIRTAVWSSENDVYRYGITLFVLISGVNAWVERYNDSDLHNWFKEKLRHHQLHLLVDPRIVFGDSNYETMYIKDEIEQMIQVALLCTQPSQMDRPEMSEVIQMLEGINLGDLKVCFAFDRANLFRYDSTPCDSQEHELPHEFELGTMIDLPTLDSKGSECTETDQVQFTSTQIIPKSEPQLDVGKVAEISSHLPVISSMGKKTASSLAKPAYSKAHQQIKSRSQAKGIYILENVWEPKMHDRWKVFLSEVVSDALPTKSKLCQSGMSVDPLCPFCNDYEEDNFHLFFKCDFSKQVWQLAVGVRIDMLGFESVIEAVDAILKPNAGVNIPSNLEPISFSNKGVAVMYTIWTHRTRYVLTRCPPMLWRLFLCHKIILPELGFWLRSGLAHFMLCFSCIYMSIVLVSSTNW